MIDAPSASCVAQRTFQGYTALVAEKPDGTQFAVMVYCGADEITYFLDANMNILGTAPVGGLISGMVYSPDGRYLYMVSDP